MPILQHQPENKCISPAKAAFLVAAAVGLDKLRIAIAGAPRVVLTSRSPWGGQTFRQGATRGDWDRLRRRSHTGQHKEHPVASARKDLPLEHGLEVRT